MELKQFVAEALVEICEAVHSAKEQVRKSTGVAIAPGSVDDKICLDPSFVEFDVSVAVSESRTKSGEGSVGMSAITVVSAKVGIDGSIEKTSESEKHQKIRFSVPVYFQAYLTAR